MNILSISHFDLDGFGCQLSIYEKFKNNISYANTSYGNIEKTLNDYNFENFNIIFITDLNFNENEQKLLYEKLKNYEGKFVYIDHHQYDTKKYLEKINQLKNCKIIIDDTKSATLKTFESLKINNNNLKRLCKIIDIYDMWRIENKYFTFSNYFNTWFWENYEKFSYILKNNNYDLSKIKNEINNLKEKVKNNINNNINKKIFQFNDILITYNFEYNNHLQEFFNYNLGIFVFLDDNKISIRENLNLKEKYQQLAKKYNGECGGHKEAYGMIIPNLKNKYKDLIKDLIKIKEEII